MTYTLPSGKLIRIPDKTIQKSMQALKISEQEAIQMYLDDEGYMDNDEQQALDNKAKKEVKTSNIVKARAATPKTQKERVTKPDPVKEQIISTIAEALGKLGKVEIVDNRKIITLTMGEDNFKVDLSRTRKNKCGLTAWDHRQIEINDAVMNALHGNGKGWG